MLFSVSAGVCGPVLKACSDRTWKKRCFVLCVIAVCAINTARAHDNEIDEVFFLRELLL